MENNIAILPARTNTALGLKEKLFLLLAVSIVAVIVGQSFENTVQQMLPETNVFRSSINKKASGISGLLSITNQSGLPCQLWLLPYHRLNEIKGLLYVVGPHIEWTENQVKEILAWVKQGNLLIYFDSFVEQQNQLVSRAAMKKGLDRRLEKHTRSKINKEALLQKLKIPVEWLDNNAVIYNRNLPEFTHVDNLSLKTEVKIIGGQPMVACKDGAYITAIKYGQGKILIGSTPEMCTNEMLRQSSNYDNFQFLVNCFRTANGGVYFDEYCHGIQNEHNVFVYFSRRLPGLICLQLLLMLIAAQLGVGQRFGALKVYNTGRRISDIAYIEGLANVYKRSQANLVALEIIVGFWKTKLCRHLGLSARASKDEILQAAKNFSEGGTNQTAEINEVQWLSNLDRFLNDYEDAFSGSEISNTRLTQLIAQCDAFNINAE